MLRVAKLWDDEYGKWLTGPLDRLECTSLWVSSLDCEQSRWNGSQSVITAIGTDGSARKRILAAVSGVRQTQKNWMAFLYGLRNRGLTPPGTLYLGPAVIPAIAEAAADVYPGILPVQLSLGCRRAGCGYGLRNSPGP